MILFKLGDGSDIPVELSFCRSKACGASVQELMRRSELLFLYRGESQSFNSDGW